MNASSDAFMVVNFPWKYFVAVVLTFVIIGFIELYRNSRDKKKRKKH